MKKLFQILVLTSIILQVILFFLPYAWEHLHDLEELKLLSWGGYESVFDINGPVPYIVTLLYIIIFAGLAMFKKIARTAFLIITIVTALPIWGFGVYSQLDGTIGYLIALADGAILTLAYLTHLSDEFK